MDPFEPTEFSIPDYLEMSPDEKIVIEYLEIATWMLVYTFLSLFVLKMNWK